MNEDSWLNGCNVAAMYDLVTGHGNSRGLPALTNGVVLSDRQVGLWVEACRLRFPELPGTPNLGPTRQSGYWWSITADPSTVKERADILRDLVGNAFAPLGKPHRWNYSRPDRKNSPCVCVECGVPARRRRGYPCDYNLPTCPYAAWRNPTTLSIARRAYEEVVSSECCPHVPSPGHDLDCPACGGAGFVTRTAGPLKADTLAVLADALEEAGCTSARVLDHLRGPNHYRGCHVVDAVLGAEPCWASMRTGRQPTGGAWEGD